MVIGVKHRTKTTLDDATRDALRVLISTIGETPAAHRLGLSRETMARALAQLPCHRGTIDAICAALTTTGTAL